MARPGANTTTYSTSDVTSYDQTRWGRSPASAAPEREGVYAAAELVEGCLALPVQVTIRTPAEWQNADDPFIAEVRRRPLVAIFDERDGKGEGE